MPRPLFKRSGSWDRLQDWPKSSLLDNCNGAPFFSDTNDSSWLDAARKALSTSPWPGFLSFPLVSPVCPEISSTRDEHVKLLPEDKCDSKSWRISLDVSQFFPEELDIKVKEGYLEIQGKHEENQYEHGTISRSFTRKYKLPAEIVLPKMSSSLTPEGALLVEAPLGASSTSFLTEMDIPIQRKQEQ